MAVAWRVVRAATHAVVGHATRAVTTYGETPWAFLIRRGTMERMENGHFLRNALLAVVGLVVVGFVAWWVIKALFGLIFYILVGALVVGGGVYLYGRAKRSIKGHGRRSLGG